MPLMESRALQMRGVGHRPYCRATALLWDQHRLLTTAASPVLSGLAPDGSTSWNRPCQGKSGQSPAAQQSRVLPQPGRSGPPTLSSCQEAFQALVHWTSSLRMARWLPFSMSNLFLDKQQCNCTKLWSVETGRELSMISRCWVGHAYLPAQNHSALIHLLLGKQGLGPASTPSRQSIKVCRKDVDVRVQTDRQVTLNLCLCYPETPSPMEHVFTACRHHLCSGY